MQSIGSDNCEVGYTSFSSDIVSGSDSLESDVDSIEDQEWCSGYTVNDHGPIGIKGLDGQDMDLAAPYRWTQREDYVIAVLREAYNYSWASISEFMSNRYSPQAIQVRYLRSVKPRNRPLSSEEHYRFLKVLKKDWETRFHRVAREMGPGFTVKRCIRHVFAMLGLNELIAPPELIALYSQCARSEQAREKVGDSLRFQKGHLSVRGQPLSEPQTDQPLGEPLSEPLNEQTFPNITDPGELHPSAFDLLRFNQLENAFDLAEMYLLPRENCFAH
uniref:ARAD1D30118p n=1 Tax=Blastobotrys adeninivorans TaxID=409370 RepID=A0A060TBC2_BLAAD